MKPRIKSVWAKWVNSGTGSAGVGATCCNILTAAIFVGFAALIISRPLAIHGDGALYLQCAQLLLEGKLPYVDFVDTNPPLIMYINVIPVIISRAFSVNPILVFSLLVFLFSIYSTLAIRRSLVRAGMGPDKLEVSVLLLFWVFYALIFVRRSASFGQREHLFILAYFPFFVMRWLRWEGGRVGIPTALLLGFVAGIGTCIKPHFFIMFLAPELYWFISKRDFRKLVKPETITFAFVALAYGAHFLFLPDVVRDSLFGRWIPMVSRGYYVYGGGATIISLLLQPGVVFVLAMAALPLVIIPVKRISLWKMTAPLTVFTLAATFVYFIQYKGWCYHLIPAFAGPIIIMAITVGQTIRGRNTGVFRLTRALVPVCLIILFAASVICGLSIWRLVQKGVSTVPDNPTPIYKIISEHSQEGGAILVISTTVHHAYPTLVQMNCRPGSRYLCSFPIAMLYAGVKNTGNGQFPYREKDVPAEETRFLQELGEDISRFRPSLIIIDNEYSLGCPEGFYVYDYLVKVGFVNKAMRGYKRASSADGFVVFTLSSGYKE